jgi:hypothetical protein
MDAMMTATTRAAELCTKINALYRRKGELEMALQREHITQEAAMAGHVKLVQELPGVMDIATDAFLHSEIDKHDETLRLSCRVAEGLQVTLRRLLDEIAPLEIELAEATRIVEQAKREQGLRALEIQLQKDRHTVEEAFAAARLALTALNLTAARGVEQFGVEGQRLVEPVISEFRHREINPEAFGWRDSRPNYGSFRFSVTPMERK